MKGIYVLVIQVKETHNLNVGALGNLNFQTGLYAYVGSAQNNLNKRVKRHIKKEKRNFWHIDYLLGHPSSEVVAVFSRQAGKAEECVVAARINKQGNAVAGFGCSDCRCKSHLFRIRDYEFLKNYMYELNARIWLN